MVAMFHVIKPYNKITFIMDKVRLWVVFEREMQSELAIRQNLVGTE